MRRGDEEARGARGARGVKGEGVEWDGKRQYICSLNAATNSMTYLKHVKNSHGVLLTKCIKRVGD